MPRVPRTASLIHKLAEQEHDPRHVAPITSAYRSGCDVLCRKPLPDVHASLYGLCCVLWHARAYPKSLFCVCLRLSRRMLSVSRVDFSTLLKASRHSATSPNKNMILATSHRSLRLSARSKEHMRCGFSACLRFSTRPTCLKLFSPLSPSMISNSMT